MAGSDCTHDVIDVARFWSNVEVGSESQCWPWKAYKRDSGHGEVKWLGHQHAAHRIAYLLAYGEIPHGLIVRHNCDNAPCCNPRHLVTGTHADNVRDRVFRGRSAKGERNGISKLVADQVLAIATDPRPAPEIAPEYRVSVDTVRSIKQRRIWRHLWNDGAGERT